MTYIFSIKKGFRNLQVVKIKCKSRKAKTRSVQNEQKQKNSAVPAAVGLLGAAFESLVEVKGAEHIAKNLCFLSGDSYALAHLLVVG